MLLDGDDIVFTRAQQFNENLYFSRLRPDGSHTDELIQTRVVRIPDRRLEDTDLIAYNGQFAVCFRKAIGSDFYVALRQANGTWQKEVLLEDTNAEPTADSAS